MQVRDLTEMMDQDKEVGLWNDPWFINAIVALFANCLFMGIDIEFGNWIGFGFNLFLIIVSTCYILATFIGDN